VLKISIVELLARMTVVERGILVVERALTCSFAAVTDASAAWKALESTVVVKVKLDVDHVALTVWLKFGMPVIFNDLMVAGDAESSRAIVQVFTRQ
jgi:hypothetical protein